MGNLIEDLMQELNRNKELLGMYEKIPQGVFGATMIKADIKKAEKAIVEGDTVKMLSSFISLKDNE